MTAAPVDVLRVNARLNVGGIARHVAWLTAGLEDRGYRTLLVAGTVPAGGGSLFGGVGTRAGALPAGTT